MSIINPSIIPCQGTNNNWYHELLPHSNVYDLSSDMSGITPPVPALEADIAYSALDPDAISTYLWINKITATIRGPQAFNQGEFFLIMEDTAQTGNFIWSPIFSIADGEYRKSDAWPNGIKLKNTQQLCWAYLHRPYGGFNPTGAYADKLYRSIELDIFYHIGA